MGDRVSASNETVCAECGHQLASPEQNLSMDGERTLCDQCYRYLLVPGYKGAQMENLD
jgi:formylmethanofuran dehydrogenase subunit E